MEHTTHHHIESKENQEHKKEHHAQAKEHNVHHEKKQKKQSASKSQIPKALITNFVALQKVQTNLSEKLDGLTKQISELLRLFESTAKTFAENPATLTSERDKEFIDKINQLLEQDKIIAKGVVYIEERMDEVEKAISLPPLPHHEESINQEIRKEYESSQVAKPLPRV